MQTHVFLSRYTSLVTSYPKHIIAAVGVITFALSIGLARLHVEVDPDRQLPQAHPYVVAFHQVTQLFGDKDLVFIGLRPTVGTIFDEKFLLRVSTITQQIAQLPGAYAPLVTSIASGSTRDIVNTNEGLRVSPLLPPGATSLDTKDIQRRVEGEPLFRGTLVSHDFETVSISASFELTDDLSGYGDLYRAVEHVLSDNADEALAYYISGPVPLVAALDDRSRQAGRFFPMALFAVALIHYHAFRSWQAVVLPLVTGLLAVLWALGAMGHLGLPLDPLNATTPLLILAIGAGHAVQILARYYEELEKHGDNQLAIVQSAVSIGSAMLAAGIIAALSFLSLTMFGTASMRTFGFFTSFGILAALLIEATLIPAVRTLATTEGMTYTVPTARHQRLTRLLSVTGTALGRRKVASRVVGGYIILVLVSIALSGRISVDTSFKRNFLSTDPIREQDEFLNQHFSGTNVLLLTVEGAKEDAIAEPELLRGIERFQRRMEALPGVGKSLSVVDTLKRLHHTLTANASLPDDLPATKERAIQYLFLYSLSGGNDLATRLTPDNRMAKIVVFLREDSTRYGDAIIAEARRIAAEVFPPGYTLHIAGTLASNSALTETMVRGKLLNVVQIGVITVLISAVVLRSLLAGLFVAVPLAIAVMINFGVMGALDVRLDVATSAVTAMAVGIGADYAVYFLFRMREEYARDGNYPAALDRALTTSGKAVLFVSSAVGLGYSVLCLSGFRLFVQLGALVGLAMITSSLATLIVLPAMLTLISRTRWVRSVLGVPALEPRAGGGYSIASRHG